MSLSEARSKKTSRQRAKAEAERNKLIINSKSMTTTQQMVMFWNEKADKLLVPFLDKRDLIILGMGK